MNESEYWYSRRSAEQNYLDRQHEAAITNLIMEQEYKLFALLKPKIFMDGNQWCVLYGANPQDGVAGFGDSPYLAILAFNKSFTEVIK